MIRKELSLANNALNFGALLGLVLGGMSLLAYAFNFSDSSIYSWIVTLILILGLSWVVRKYKEMNDGYLSFGEAFGFGALASLGASLIYGVVHYFYIKFLSPEILEVFLEQTELALYKSDMAEDELEFTMELYKRYMTPGSFAVGLFFAEAFFGVIVSLIIAIFVKNPKPMFEE